MHNRWGKTIAEAEILSKKGEDAFDVPGDVGITLGTSYNWRVPTLLKGL